MTEQKTNLTDNFSPYQIISTIAKGGMGEVLYAYDPIYQRYVALKHIRADVLQTETLKKRFLNEARITSSLAHPNIIPIYSMHIDKEIPYYTMPYVEGNTLKGLLRESYEAQKNTGIPLSENSIRSLMRIFLTVCEAMSYTHAQGVLHRDLKPDNILVGKFGEVLIFDWGVAEKLVSPQPEQPSTDHPELFAAISTELTLPGKIVGTLPYMAPERIFSKPASVLTDIYSLGVMLYLILTLRLPFKRKSLKEARRNLHKERWVDPTQLAPYRDIPQMLVQVVKKCLHPNPTKRYQSLPELIKDIKQYVEGRSEWFLTAELNVQRPSDWQFHENILLTKHIAISQDSTAAEWVSLMTSNGSFEGNIKLEASVRISQKCQGIGFIINVPELVKLKRLCDGYMLWLSGKKGSSSKFFRSQVEVLSLPETSLEPDVWHHIRLEKVDNNLYFYLDDELKSSYISYLPIIGKHVGVLYKDDNFEIKDLSIFTASPTVLVSCLAVPDALMAYKAYFEALNEYRRIGFSFPGRREGREAMFRAGVTLLEAAKHSKKKQEKEELYTLASVEFEKLRHTPAAPLEYLGKALVYEAQNDTSEEMKCLELVLRRYPNHPLHSLLYEHISYRMHQSSRQDRIATYQFALLLLHFFPFEEMNADTRALIFNLYKKGPALFYIEKKEVKDATHLATYLSASLNKPHILLEILDRTIHKSFASFINIKNVLFALLYCKQSPDMGNLIQLLEGCKKNIKHIVYDVMALFTDKTLEQQIDDFLLNKEFIVDQHSFVICQYFLEEVIRLKQHLLMPRCIQAFDSDTMNRHNKEALQEYHIIYHLLEGNYSAVTKIFQNRSYDPENPESSIFTYLYGLLLASKDEKKALLFYDEVLVGSRPPLWSLGALFLTKKLGSYADFSNAALPYECYELCKQLYLYYKITKHPKKEAQFYQLWQHLFLDPLQKNAL